MLDSVHSEWVHYLFTHPNVAVRMQTFAYASCDVSKLIFPEITASILTRR